jgi:hypothetical protein
MDARRVEAQHVAVIRSTDISKPCRNANAAARRGEGPLAMRFDVAIFFIELD